MQILQKLWQAWELSKFRIELVGISTNYKMLDGSSPELIQEIQNIFIVQRNTLIIKSTKARTPTEIAERDGAITLANNVIMSLEKFKKRPVRDPKTGVTESIN